MKVPRYYEWSLEVQQGVGWNSTLGVMYVAITDRTGDIEHGAECVLGDAVREPADAPVDPRFGVVSEQQNIANSNYSGW